MNQVSVLYDLWPKHAEWFVIGGPAQELEAQTLYKKYAVKCIGFEPNPDAVVAQNGPLRFPGKVHQCALWRNEADELKLTVPIGRSLCGSVCRPENSPDLVRADYKWESYAAQPRTLDSLSRELGPFNNAVLWLDIEYAELPALEGATELLNRTLMVNLETHVHTNLASIVRLLTKYGLYLQRVWNIGEVTQRDCQDYIFTRNL